LSIATWLRKRLLTNLTEDEARELYAKSNPVIPSLVNELRSYSGAGVEPLDQNYTAYIEQAKHRFPWIAACVDAIANAAASVPLKVVRATDDGAEELPEHPLMDLLWNPNPEDGLYSLVYKLHQQLGLTGEAFLTTEDSLSAAGRDPALAWKDPEELWIQRSDRMKPQLDKSRIRDGKAASPIAAWTYDGPGGKITFAPEQVIQVKRPHPTDPIHGLSPLKELEPTLNLMWSAMAWNKGYFANATLATLLITRETKPANEEIARFVEQFTRDHTGVANVGKAIMLWGKALQATPISDTPTDASFMELMAWCRAEILSVFKVPPFALGLLEHANWSNSREQQQFFYRNAVMPANQLITDTLNSSPLVLLAEGNTPSNQPVYLEHDYSEIEALQPNRRELAEVDAIYLRHKVRTPNEIRQARNFGEDTEWGDEPFEQGGFSMLDAFADYGSGWPESVTADDYAELKRLAVETQTKDARGARWKAHALRSESIERAWVRKVRPLLRELRDEVLDTIDAKRRGLAARSKAEPDDPVPPDWTEDEFFDSSAAEADWLDAIEPLGEDTLKAGAEDILREINDEFTPFDTDNEAIREFLARTIAADVTKMLDTQKELVRDLVRQAAEEQWTIRRLEQEFRDRHIRNERFRSMMIARTETAKLYNKGATEGMAEAGVTAKEWLSARDEDVRESHAYMDGKAVGLNDDFILPSGARGPFPGQIDRAEESVNCRCTVIPGDV